MDSSPPPPPTKISFPSVAAIEDEEPLSVAPGTVPDEGLLEQASDHALAQLVANRLNSLTELKAKLHALELSMAEVVEENKKLKQKLADKEKECGGLQQELADVQIKMAEIITNITHLNEASSTTERRPGGGRKTHPAEHQ